MEVHHHAHTARKKWTHYLWEFLMLFLAVFCGFLAENFREHQVEHRKEKQFMKSMVVDLAADTAELKKAILKCDSIGSYSDSTLIFLSSYKISKEIPEHLSYLVGIAGQNQSLINNDRTASQLKNSGGMRLIQKSTVSDAILYYWEQVERTKITLERYKIYRNASRELSFKLWVIPEVYISNNFSNTNGPQMLKVLDTDSKKWGELANLIAMNGFISKQSHLNNLNKQLRFATELINLIKNEYHLK